MFAALRARSEPQYEELPVIKALMAAAVAHAKQRGADALGLRTLLHHLLIAEPPALITKLLADYAVSPDPEALQEREPQSGTPQCPQYAAQVVTVLARVIVQCETSGTPSKQVKELDLLAALASEPESAQILEQLGLTRLQIVYFRNHGQALPADPALEIGEVEDPTIPAWVRMDNDDYSTMESVVAVLGGVFELAPERAKEVMLEIHQSGSVLLGPYAHEVARERALRAVAAARAAGQPLKVELSRRGAWHDDAATPRQMWDAMWHETSGGHRDGLLSLIARHWHGEGTVGIKYMDLRVGLSAWLLMALLFAAYKLHRDGPLWLFATALLLWVSIGTWLGIGYWVNARNMRRRGIRRVRAMLLQLSGVFIIGAVLAACVMLSTLRWLYSQ